MSEIHTKLFVSLRYFLIGRKFYTASEALEYASHFHTKTRKDGVTPEFQHQLEIAHYLRTLESGLLFPEETYAAVALHDVCEDADVGYLEIESKFGPQITEAVKLLTKTHRGQKKDMRSYFAELATNPISSVVKGADRIHNIQSMVGVFNFEKQLSYIKETEEFILPAMKAARRVFPSQEAAYENIKQMLTSQIKLIQAIHAAARPVAANENSLS